MRIFFKIMAVIILLLLIFLVGIFKFRQHQANQILIPKNTTAIIKVNMDEIYKSLAFNMIAHPGFYFNSFKKDSTSTADKLESGLNIPASIYFYTVKGQASTTLFTRFNIDDPAAFESFLKNTLRLTVSKKQNGTNYAKNGPGNVVLYFNSKDVAMAVSGKAANFGQILTDILLQKNFEPVSSSYNFKTITNDKEHISFIEAGNSGNINFKNGELLFSYVRNQTVNTTLKSGISHSVPNGESIAYLWYNGSLSEQNTRKFQYKNLKIQHDSINKYFDDYLDFEWTKSMSKTDSVITYEYNDDFEKVEKISLQKNSLPLFALQLDLKSVGLKNYLSKIGLIDPDSSTINRNIFPVYKVYTAETDKSLTFSTQKNFKINAKTIKSDDFFYLNINFYKLNEALKTPLIAGYTKALKRLEIKGNVMESKRLKFNGKMELIKPEINSLYQIIKSIY